ncbi:MAG TPA: tRNA lysidine(34) synthetase TilS [Kofleriaceae bacterium]|nr:tRNA lysidine(34) synthetase TilS [Kofleriaceae bacterium]
MASTVRAAVAGWLERIGPGLYGVACSGGPDSLALADAAIAAAGASHVVIVSIDHGLHAGSARVAADVAAWARGQGAAAVVRRVTCDRSEAGARAARLSALDAIADELGLACVMLGHTARDQAETVLMRVVRGTGPAGLAGIPARRGRFVRPLLDVPRDAIEAYVRAHRLSVHADPMNADDRYFRVRIRGRYVPALRSENPALDDALVRLAASAREWTEVIDALATPFAHFPIDCRMLAAQPAAIRKRALALALGLGYDATHLDALDALVTAPARGEVALDLPGVTLVRSYDLLQPQREPPSSKSDLLVPAGYELRHHRPGDRMRPARLKGRSRKLSDLYVDAKIPRDQRAAARVLVRTRDRAIVWAEFIGDAYDERPPRMAGRF